MIVRFVGGPSDKHVVTIYGAPDEMTFPVAGPLQDPGRERIAVYRLEKSAGGAIYRYTETKDA